MSLLGLSELQACLVLKIIEHELSLWVEDIILIQQTTYILYAEIELVHHIIHNAELFMIEPQLLHMTTIDRLTRKTQDNVGIIQAVLFGCTRCSAALSRSRYFR